MYLRAHIIAHRLDRRRLSMLQLIHLPLGHHVRSAISSDKSKKGICTDQSGLSAIPVVKENEIDIG